MEKTFKGHLVIVVGFEHYCQLGILRTFGEAGISPVFVGVKYKAPVASVCKYIQECHIADTIPHAYEITMKEYGHIGEQDPTKKPFLLFGDDDVYSYFEDHYEDVMSRFITFNAGQSGRVKRFMLKKEIIDLCEKHGIPTLSSIVVPTDQIPEGINYPVVTKATSPLVGAWKGDFHICENEEQLKESMSNIKADEILIQPYVDKKTELTYEAMSYNHGKNMFTGAACTYMYNIRGYYSPFFKTFFPENSELLKKIGKVIEEVGFDGIWDAEFIVDKNDNLWLLEFNFRNSGWAYASTVAGNPLALLWCEAMLTGKCREPKEFKSFLTMIEPVDFAKRVDTGLCTLPQWLGDFKRTKCPMYYHEEDIEPWNVAVANWEILK